MTSTAGAGGSKSLSDKLGLSRGLVVQELGWDEDVDDDVRMMVEDAIVDALTDLADSGYIWLMTPKVGRSGYVDAADVAEAALTAGLALTNSVQASPDWTATKLVRPKGARR